MYRPKKCIGTSELEHGYICECIKCKDRCWVKDGVFSILCPCKSCKKSLRELGKYVANNPAPIPLGKTMGTTLKKKIPTHPCLNCPHKQTEVEIDQCDKCGKCDKAPHRKGYYNQSHYYEFAAHLCEPCGDAFYKDMKKLTDEMLNTYLGRSNAISKE